MENKDVVFDAAYAILTEDINRVKCPFCARTVHISMGENGVKDCPYCNKQFVLPENDNEAISDEDFVDIECPFCGNTVSVDIALNELSVVCPFCDKVIEYSTEE